ncbi:hypothetical protein MRX96_055234 [Rhipicephalus microplus]
MRMLSAAFEKLLTGSKWDRVTGHELENGHLGMDMTRSNTELTLFRTTRDLVMAKAVPFVILVIAVLCSKAAAQLGLGLYGGVGPYFRPGFGYGGYGGYGVFGGYGYPGLRFGGGYGGFGPGIGFFGR